MIHSGGGLIEKLSACTLPRLFHAGVAAGTGENALTPTPAAGSVILRSSFAHPSLNL